MVNYSRVHQSAQVWVMEGLPGPCPRQGSQHDLLDLSQPHLPAAWCESCISPAQPDSPKGDGTAALPSQGHGNHRLHL